MDQGTALTARRTRRALGALLGVAALLGQPAAAHAEVTSLPGVALPVPASDVTSCDQDLSSTGHEVVVAVTGTSGLEVRKLRTRTQAEADALVDEFAADGLTAEPNSTYSVAAGPTLAGSKAGRLIDLSRAPGMQAASGVLTAEPLGGQQWGMAAVGAEGAWALSRGAGITVAVVDSGVDATHPDLAGRVLPQINLVHDGAEGDPLGHGTHVAGIIGAALDGAGSAGLANRSRIRPVRVIDVTGSGDTSTISAGIIAAARSGAKVINLSLGGATRSGVIATAVKYATDRGITVVAAAGNLYAQGNPVIYPAALPRVIGVSAVNRQGRSSAFAETGSYVDMSAPGEDILSTVPGGGYARGDGTSMAAPFVSAAAALVRAANPHLSATKVRQLLDRTALDDTSRDHRDAVFGAGLLQVDSAVRAAARLPYGVRAPAVSLVVRPVRSASWLYVNVEPNKGSGHWSLRVQRRTADGTWRAVRTVRSLGRRETRMIPLPAGTYRVVVAAKYGYRSTTSAPVTLAR